MPMKQANPVRAGTYTVAACLLLTFAVGSLHAFSVLLAPIEQETGVGRTMVSLIYSTALLSLTISVLIGHKIYRRLSAPKLALLVGVLPMLGVGLISTGSWIGWMIGYGILFGFASGTGYGFALHAAARGFPAQRRGSVIGAATAFYALGAFAFSLLYPTLLGRLGLSAGYFASTIIIIGLSLMSAGLFYLSQVQTQTDVNTGEPSGPARGLIRLWFAYGTGAFAGLMVLGHALPIMQGAGNPLSVAIAGLVVVTLGNAAAGVCVGWLADRIDSRGLLVAITMISAVALAGLAFFGGSTITTILIGLVGATYGAFIALFPLIVSRWSGHLRATWAYGRVFTAWGLAGITAQPVAGWLFELTRSYQFPLLIAALLSLAAGLILASLDVKSCREPWR